MKVCPVCNESFEKELNFCDVDGARLTRQNDASGTSEPSKIWPLLGVGLLLGALAISAASIFLSKNRVNPPVSVSGSVPAESSTRARTPETPSTEASPTAATDESVPGTDEIALAEMKKKERALAAASQSSGPGPNPKAAALAVEESEKSAAKEDNQAPVEAQPLNAETTKAMSDAREPQPPPKPVPAMVETKDAKKQAVDTKAPAKDSNNKKKADEKEKKGGFLRVFKKIFGKD